MRLDCLRTHTPVLLIGLVLLHGPTSTQAAGQVPAPRDTSATPAPTGALRGRVVDASTGAPIRRASVSAYSEALADKNVSTRTDASGRFELPGLPPGRYVVAASKAGYFFGLESQRSRPPRLVVTAGPPTSAGTLGLTRGGVITGRVIDETGEPLPRVTVRAVRVVSQAGHVVFEPNSEERTDDLGRYRIFWLIPGEYVVGAFPDSSLSLEPPSTTGYAATYFPGTPSRVEAQRIRVTAGSEVPSVNVALALTRTVRVSGTVIDSRGRPITEGFISIGEGDENSFGTRSGAAIGSDGRFFLPPTAPWAIVLMVQTGGMEDPETESAFIPMTLGSEDVTDLSIVTSPAAVVAGRVVFDPAPADPAIVPSRFPLAFDVRTPMFGGTMARPDADGSFEVRLHGEGRAVIRNADQWPRGWMVDAVSAGGVDVTDAGIEFHAGESQRDVQIVLTDKGAALTGTVIDDRGAPVAEAAVLVIPDAGAQAPTGLMSAVFSAQSAEDGRFTVSPIRSGAYRVVALQQVNAWDPTVVAEWRASGTACAFTRGERKVLTLTVLRGP